MAKLLLLLIIVALIAVGIYMFNIFKKSGSDQNITQSIGVTITKEQAIEIVKEDVQLGFDTNFYNIEARLEPDGWHVDYSFKNLPHGVIGGGAPHYIVNSETGAVIKKWFDNNR